MDTLQLEESEYNLIKFPKEEFAYINAAMKDIIWLSMLHHIKKNYLERQVADSDNG